MHRLALVAMVVVVALASAAGQDDADQKLDSKYGVATWPDEPGAGAIRKLHIEKYNTAAKDFELRFLEYRVGRGTLDVLLRTNKSLADAAAELEPDAKKRIARLEKLALIDHDIEEINKEQYERGRLKLQDVLSSTVARLDAQIRIEREKQALKQTAK